MGRAKARLACRVKTSRWRAGRFSIRFAVALVFLPLVAAAEPNSSSAAASPAGQGATPIVGATAAGFDLRTLDGEPVRLEKFRGRPLVMSFLASWCGPCREEMPVLNALASRADRNGYAVLGIAIQDRRAPAMEFVRETGVVFPIALDLNNKVQRAYRVFGPPATFFVDAQGVVRDAVLGPITPERAREALEKAGVRQ